MLMQVLQDIHVAVNAEILLLCTKMNELENGTGQGTDFNGWKKVVKVELDMHAVDVLHALRRMKLGTYGKCVRCNAEIPFEDLRSNPTERFCAKCRLTQKLAAQN